MDLISVVCAAGAGYAEYRHTHSETASVTLYLLKRGQEAGLVSKLMKDDR